MVVGGAQDLVQHLGDPIHRLRHERHVLHAERDLQRLQRLPAWRRAAWCCCAARCGEVGEACFLVSP